MAACGGAGRPEGIVVSSGRRPCERPPPAGAARAGVLDRVAPMQWDRTVRPLTAELLFEREHELALVALAVGRAAEGAGSVVLVDGAAGVGKTRLLREASARAEATGIRVLAATGGEVERDLGWGVARAVLGGAVDSGGRDWSGAARLALPLFREGGPAAEVSLGGLLHGLYWICPARR